MAEGREVLFSSGSEYIYDFFCELCFDDGKHMQAYGYCSDCEEYLCEKCFNGHTSTRQTRHHVLLDKETMPKDTPISIERINKDISTKCKIHKAKPVEFYCPVHKVLGCSTCFATVHKCCPDVESVIEQAEHILESQEFRIFKTTLENLNIKSDEMIKLLRDNKCLSNKCWTDLVSSVKQIKEEAIQAIPEAESNILAMADRIRFEDGEQMEHLDKECTVMAQQIKDITTECESVWSSKRVCQLYIKMKEKKEKIHSLKESLINTELKNSVRSFKFETNVKLNVLGGIVFDDTYDTGSSTCKEPGCVTCTDVGHFKVEWIESRNYSSNLYNITGMAVLSSNKLILVDKNHEKVAMVDTFHNTVVSQTDIMAQPWDVTVINKTQVAVTLPDSKKILILGVSDTLKVEREITVRGACHGIAFGQGRLVVTYTDTARLEILDLHGHVIKTIEHDCDGSKLFTEPKYICVNKNGTIMYVSDYKSNTITGLTFDGVVKSRYVYKEKEGIQYPDKLCTDHRGNVYVCGATDVTECLYRLTADCSKCEAIVPYFGGYESGAQSVSHCSDTNRLYVGMYGDKSIYVLQLS